MDGQGAGLYGFQHSSAPVKKVHHVQFGILSPEEIVRSFFSLVGCGTGLMLWGEKKSLSVAKIESFETTDGDGKAKLGGLLDPRMGTIDRNFKCQTCGENMTECPGHFAHIELLKPVYHPGAFISSSKLFFFFDFIFSYSSRLTMT